MNRHSRPTAAVSSLAVVAAALTLVLADGRPALSDDTDLLRFNTAKPYVFFLLDTSASMTLSPAGKWLPANGDDPRSKLYKAKQVLHKVFKDVDDIHFGFAYMNQDHAAAATKHWLYYYTGGLPASWPIPYPKPEDANGPVKYDKDGFAYDDVQGDLMTFGPHIEADGEGGTCSVPLKLSTEEEKINRFSKLGALGSGPTVIWISSSGKTYRLTVTRPAVNPNTNSANAKLGEDGMNVKLDLDEISNCTGPVVARSSTANLDLTLWTDFLMFDENEGSVDAPDDTHNGGVDKVAGFWDFKDVLDEDALGDTTCGSGHPFSGKGWEGNYDGSMTMPIPGSISGSVNDKFDRHCVDKDFPLTCYNLKSTTTFDLKYGRPLDRGDLLPLDWRTENKDEFLSRLAPGDSSNPRFPSGPNFRIASYFKDSPDGVTKVLPLVDASRSPLLGTGPSPLSKMVVDFRCWYQGEGNKCNDEAFNPGGWEGVAKQWDAEWGCRRPYLIVISDGGDTCTGENPCADTADLNSKSSVRTWVIAFGANGGTCGKPPLSCMAQNGKGELLCPQDAGDLEQELRKILGLIREETRAFASAAVPSIQTNIDQRIFLTDFTPLNNKSVWDGHFDAYLKPVPPISDTDPRPDRNKNCTGAEGEQGCHLWDAGERILTQVNGLGAQGNQRRVYYPRETDSGPVTPYIDSRRPLEKPLARQGTSDPEKALWEDLMRALDIPFASGNDDTERAHAAQVIDKTLAVKSATLTDSQGNTRIIQYLLGDIFHSNPLVVGSPPNTKYFSDDLHVQEGHGYRDFFRTHELRRKMAIVGSNDGMLHFFDAGMFNASTEKFGNGTGKELFAYIPRAVMPTLTKLADGTQHKWGVDGTVTVADVFIDPLHGASPVAGNRDWRTVLFGGLREGGTAYFALDITQPDTLAPVNGIENVPQPGDGGYVPSCLDSGCTLRFPAALWEFHDTVLDSVLDSAGKAIPTTPLDEDGVGGPDLGDTWSIPNVGRIQLTEGTATVEKFVMVVGGGFDADHKNAPNEGSGTWLYMIDAETGKTIYKRKLDGAVPSEPAAVDTDQDGFLDRIYVGTTNGKMYRVDLTADTPGKTFPALEDKDLVVQGTTYTVKRVPETSWKPRLLFDANTGLSAGLARPIFYRPSVIFVPSLGRYALSFGTGDREDLWNKSLIPGRFYVFVDDSEDLAKDTVLDETRFQQITVTDPSTATQYLLSNPAGNRGWFLVLEPDERLITDAFALAGVTFFSTFQPDIIVTGTTKDPLCSKTGTSRIFVVSTVNANPFLTDASGNLVRNQVVNDFVTNPFTEDRTLNTASSESPTPPKETCDEPTMNQLRETLKSLFPVNCRFGNQTIDIKTISSKTALLCIAPVPVCTVEKNWREQH